LTLPFRIFQEALINVARHSGADKVTVLFREEDGYLTLEVMDNGRGIKEDEMLGMKSLGILGMRERALVFGGELSISGEPGGGTPVVLKIPCGRE
jgi:two-component system sensor histidine kinase UhpB